MNEIKKQKLMYLRKRDQDGPLYFYICLRLKLDLIYKTGAFKYHEYLSQYDFTNNFDISDIKITALSSLSEPKPIISNYANFTGLKWSK